MLFRQYLSGMTEVSGPDAAEPEAHHKSVRCRVGAHHWETRTNDEGQTYRTCAVCGEDEFFTPTFLTWASGFGDQGRG